MKRLLLQFFAVLLFFAGLGVNVVKYGCDACREHSAVIIGMSCTDIHLTTTDNEATCCGSTCSTGVENTNHAHHENHQDCTSERLSIPLDSYVAKVQLTKSSFTIPSFLLSNLEIAPSLPNKNDVKVSSSIDLYPYFLYEDYLSKISVFII
jgi:hypothetical protein